MERRVVVTGVGCITPLGNTPEVAWDTMIAGRSGAGPITLFDAHNLPVKIAAEVSDWQFAEHCPDLEPWFHHTRQTQFAIAAAVQAQRGAGLQDANVAADRIGVCLGCGEVFPDFYRFANSMSAAMDGSELNLGRLMRDLRHDSLCPPDLDWILDPAAAASGIAAVVNAEGPNSNFTSACVSSTKAIGDATETIRRGAADIMLAGGFHSMIHPFGITGFHRLSTLSTFQGDPRQAARPFDRHRDGFVVGEGGAVFVLEELEQARQRGVQIWAEVSGWSITHDAYRITDLDPEGRTAARAITLALNDAQLNPEDIDYINAHGTGTGLNDKTETRAVKHAFGGCAYHVPMSSTKSMTGHLTTACGAIETMACLMAIRDKVVPPTINLEDPDPECDLDYVPNTARQVPVKHAMNNSFGFGGQNVALILSQYDG